MRAETKTPKTMPGDLGKTRQKRKGKAGEEEGKSGRRGREKREKDRPMLERAKRKGKEPAGENRGAPLQNRKPGMGEKER